MTKATILGFERYKSFSDIEQMARAMEENAEFPYVDVIPLGNGVYELSRWLNGRTKCLEGGHHRSVAHYIMQKPMRVRVVNKPSVIDEQTINIEDIVIVGD